MTAVITKWVSLETPSGFEGSVERADIVLRSLSIDAHVRVMALRKDAPYSVTLDDAEKFVAGGDEENPRCCEAKSICGQRGYFSSRSHEQHRFNTVIDDTLVLISSVGFGKVEATAAIEATLAGLTINHDDC